MHSATQILALKEWKVGFIKMFNHKPLLFSDDRSLLFYCTVLVLATLQYSIVEFQIHEQSWLISLTSKALKFALKSSNTAHNCT